MVQGGFFFVLNCSYLLIKLLIVVRIVQLEPASWIPRPFFIITLFPVFSPFPRPLYYRSIVISLSSLELVYARFGFCGHSKGSARVFQQTAGRLFQTRGFDYKSTAPFSSMFHPWLAASSRKYAGKLMSSMTPTKIFNYLVHFYLRQFPTRIFRSSRRYGQSWWRNTRL